MSAFNGSGVFQISGTGLPYVPNTTISSSVANTLNNNLATGLSTCICKDGQSTPTNNIPMGGFKLINLANGTAATDAAAFGQLAGGLGGLQGFIGGLTLSATGSTGTFGIASGAATDSTNAQLMTLASAYTKTTANWVVGSGNGALDTGSIAISTWYHVFEIERTDTAIVDILFSLSPSSPTLPTGYTLFRRIGSMQTDGSSHWNAFTQIGNDFIWASAGLDANGVSLAAADTLQLLGSVPTGILVKARMQGAVSSGANCYVSLTTPSQITRTPNTPTGNATVAFSTATLLDAQFGPLDLYTNTAAQIYTRASTVSGTPIIYINTLGWMDIRGQG